MIYFFHGDDTYRLKEKVRSIKDSFLVKGNSDLNLTEIDGSKLSMDKFVNTISSMPFLGDKRLSIIRNFMLENSNKELKKKVLDFLPDVPEWSTIIFVEEGIPDKRESMFKFFEKSKLSTYFGALDEINLRKWDGDRFKKEDIKIDSAALAKLTLYVGNDLWRLENEISRISAYTRSIKQSEITVQIIEELIEPNLNVKIFDLTDALASRNDKKTLEYLYQFEKSGEDLFRIFNLIVYQFRNMIVVADCKKKGMDSTNIARESGMHPFVVKKTESVLKKYKEGELESIYEQLNEADWQIKSGAEKIETILPLLLVNFCRSDKII